MRCLSCNEDVGSRSTTAIRRMGMREGWKVGRGIWEGKHRVGECGGEEGKMKRSSSFDGCGCGGGLLITDAKCFDRKVFWFGARDWFALQNGHPKMIFCQPWRTIR